MAVRAGNFSLFDRMTRGPVDLSALLLVADKAHFGLGALVAHFVVSGMHLMARRTGCVTAGVDAARPVDALAALVTT